MNMRVFKSGGVKKPCAKCGKVQCICPKMPEV